MTSFLLSAALLHAPKLPLLAVITLLEEQDVSVSFLLSLEASPVLISWPALLLRQQTAPAEDTNLLNLLNVQTHLQNSL